MLIETWVAVLFLVVIGGIAIASLIGWMNDAKRLEESQKENARLREEVHIRNTVIEKLNGKLLVKEAKNYFEGAKK